MSLKFYLETEDQDRAYTVVEDHSITFREPQTIEDLENVFLVLARNIGFSYVARVECHKSGEE